MHQCKLNQLSRLQAVASEICGTLYFSTNVSISFLLEKHLRIGYFNQWNRLQKTINTWMASSSATSSVDFPFERPEQINDYVYQVHKPAGRPSIEIVFVHGLLLEGSGKEAYLTTWLSAEGSELWPTWILKDFQDARILLVSYDASAQRNNEQGIMDMYQTCENLVHSLTEETANVGGAGCPVILVGHSIGCLVIKELCAKLHSAVNRVLPHNRKESVQNLLQNVKGLFYYACPHHGSRLADNSAGFPKGPLFEGITTLNTEAQRRNEDFRELRRKYKWKTFGIGEGRPTTLGQFEDYVVSEASARCDVDEYYTCDYANHFNVCRPKCRSSSTFGLLSHFVGSVLQESVRCKMSIDRWRKDRDLHSPKICTPKGVYGLERHVSDIMEKLSRGVRRLGIIGMGGVGKTTLAGILYQTISRSFEYTCFLRNVKKSMASKDNLEHLRKKIRKNLVYKGCKVKDTFNWETLRRKKVLIVLDDVERESQVQVMLEDDGFSDGSCVIATSREKGFLRGENFDCHVLEKLGKEDSKKLFCLNAFGKEEVDESVFKWRTEQFLKRCEGLPLALKIVGKYLHRQDRSVWDDALQKMRNAKPLNGSKEDGLWSILRVCYESLAEVEQEMFLDVATCFHDQDMEKVKQAWSTCPWASPSSGLKNLEDKGLVTIEENILIEENSQPRRERIIRMHEVLRDLGRSIACPTESVGAHTRLRYDLSNPLQTTQLFNEGKAQVKVLIIHRCEDISIQSLQGLEELRVLWLEDVILHGPLNLLPSNLAYLRITDSTLFIESEGSHSQSDSEVSEEREKKRQRLWQISALKQLEINACELLEGSLDGLRQFHALERLEISSLSNWTAVSDSLGELRALKDLRVISCDQLECIPYSLGRLLALKYLVIQDCQKVKAIPDSLWQLQALEHLVVSCGCFKAPPNVLRRLRALRRFETTCCQNWEDVLDSFAELEALENIAIHSCIDHGYPVIDQLRLLESLTQRNLLQGFGQVDLPIFYEDSVLEIRGWNTEYLPNSFVGAGRVTRLLIKDCRNLKTLPYEVGSLKVLEDLRIVNCGKLKSLPDSIGELKALQSLSITSCRSLKSLPNTIRELQALTYLRISCGTKLKAPPNTVQQVKALRLEITWCHFRRWKDFLETLGQLRTLQTLVIHSCIHSYCSVDSQLEFLESLTRRGLLQGPGRVDLPVFHSEHVTIKGTIPSNFFHLGHPSSLTINTSRGIKVIPNTLGDLRALRRLDILSSRKSSLKSLPDTLGKLEALERLRIEGCWTLEALPDSLGELRALQEFTATSCAQLKSLPEGVGKLEALRELHIHGCRILEALPDSLGELRALQKFTVASCWELKSLPEGVGKLEALREFHIAHCSNLEALPDSLGELRALQEFTVVSCGQLKSFPKDVGKLEALKKLRLEKCNSLGALPDSLEELQALQKFEVISCRELKSLPEGVGKLEALREFHIAHCSNLEALPDSLGELRALQEFTVVSCGQLKSFPKDIGKLEALKKLRLEKCNSLGALPDSLEELQALQKFEVISCRELKSLPEGVGKLEALREFHIARCSNLEALPDSLGELRALQKFTVASCWELKSLPEGVGKLEALREFHIAHCSNLEALPDSLGELRALQVFTVWSCGQLKSLPEGVGKLEVLREFHIAHCSNLEALPDSLGELRALQEFTVVSCGQLKSFPKDIGKLESLKKLRIEECNSLGALPDSLEELRALQKFEVISCTELKSLPEGVGKLEALREFHIAHCSNLEALPDSLGELRALQEFTVVSCGQLKSFPKDIGKLESLKKLRIVKCNS